ncbi:hypothetical protein [Kitasatospora sp. NPDC098663]|uniref:hypothetical protein n=1 Tax=Kitasatospora sp. NPDC098663 TaxID=3364096 RepID=UPI003815C152
MGPLPAFGQTGSSAASPVFSAFARELPLTEPFRRRHLVYVAHFPDHLAAAVAAVEQDDPDRAPAVRPDTAAGGPLLLPAMTGASYQWR